MAPRRRARYSGRPGASYSENTVGRTQSVKDKGEQKTKPTDVFDFPDNSGISSIDKLGENEQDEEPYETFAPPLHSTAIYADEEELSKHCGSSIPSTPQGKEAERNLTTSENEESEGESLKKSTKKPGRKPKPIIDESESSDENDVRRKVKPAEKISIQHESISVTASSELSEKTTESITPKETAPLSVKSSVEEEVVAKESQQKTLKKRKMSHSKKKNSRSKSVDSDSDVSSCVHIWCLEGKKTGDITELDVVLSAFEKTLLEYKQRIQSKICKEAIHKFNSDIKEELIKSLKEAQMLKNLKRKNAKMISDIIKKRQHLVEVQDELLRLPYEKCKEQGDNLLKVTHLESGARM
ncbi:centromere protein U isoform X1 [Tamandua tetradactyla]|uniref:centromere protein U isoform X1 n=1 Tax=Tamandua tetradactyla TaxID=48850 RepID=UPI0040542C08